MIKPVVHHRLETLKINFVYFKIQIQPCLPENVCMGKSLAHIILLIIMIIVNLLISITFCP